MEEIILSGVSKNLLIVGGSGFIGRHLVSGAISKGYSTTVLSLRSVDKEDRIAGADYLTSDIVDYKVLKKNLSGKNFTHIVNLGGYINHARFKEGGRQILDAHFYGVQNLLEIIDWNTLEMFVQIGSSDEYGDAPAPQSENIRERPISSYALGKLASNQMLQMLHRTEDFPVVILRLFLVYGPGQDDKRFLPQIIKGCLNNETFDTSLGEQLRDFCYVDDITRGILMALESCDANGEVINLASGKPISIREVVELVNSVIAKGTPLFGKIPYRIGENMELYADINKAKNLLNWAPQIDLLEGIERTVKYYNDGNV